MCGVSFIPATHKKLFHHLLPMQATETTYINYNGKLMEYTTSDIQCGNLDDYDVVNTISHKSKYHWINDFYHIKIKANGKKLQ